MSNGFDVRVADDEITPALRRALKASGDLTPAMKVIGELLLRSTDQNFTGQHGPDGRPWRPLQVLSYHLAYRNGQKKSTHTKAGKLTAGFQRYLAKRKVLTDSGQLRGSIAYRAKKDSVAVGSGKVYSAIHQLGGKAGRGRKVTIPARPFLGVGPADRVEILETLKDHLQRAING